LKGKTVIAKEPNGMLKIWVRRLVGWKPSASSWRFYQFLDNLLYGLAWPFLIASWSGFLGVCLLDFVGVTHSPMLLSATSICLGFSYLSCGVLLSAILAQATLPFVFWRGFVDYHILIAKHRRDDRGMFAMATSAKILACTLLPCMVIRGLFYLTSKIILMDMSNIATYAFCKAAAFVLAKAAILAVLGFGMLLFVTHVFDKIIPPLYNNRSFYNILYNKRQLSGAISSMALLEKEPSDLGEDNDYLDKIQKDLYYASSHERANFTLSSLATSLYSVVNTDPPNQDCISSADAYKWEK
tara:strand:- start:271 stop:1164 length:894 start_codon:yes stop_codon:yes gene_type:complete